MMLLIITLLLKGNQQYARVHLHSILSVVPKASWALFPALPIAFLSGLEQINQGCLHSGLAFAYAKQLLEAPGFAENFKSSFRELCRHVTDRHCLCCSEPLFMSLQFCIIQQGYHRVLHREPDYVCLQCPTKTKGANH